MYVCMYVCMNVCMYVCMYVRMYVCMYARFYVFMYICVYICMFACMYVCIYVCMYICVCMCIYMMPADENIHVVISCCSQWCRVVLPGTPWSHLCPVNCIDGGSIVCSHGATLYPEPACMRKRSQACHS